MWWFEASARPATPKGQTFISCKTPSFERLTYLHRDLRSSFVAHVLVVDDPIGNSPRLFRRGGRPGLGEDVPVGDVLTAVGLAPFSDHLGQPRDFGAEDE
jgi:hypothetical protein